MTLHEKVVLSAYTGILMCDMAEVHKYIDCHCGMLLFYEIDFVFMLYLLEPIRKSIAVDSMRNISGMPAIGIAAPISALFAVTQIEPISRFDFCHKDFSYELMISRKSGFALFLICAQSVSEASSCVQTGRPKSFSIYSRPLRYARNRAPPPTPSHISECSKALWD